MPTNRPFLANLLVAFRAHSAASKASSSSSSPSPKPSKTSPTQSTPSAQASVTNSAIQQQASTPTSPRRRSSSSSSGGYAEPLTGEKWWIGGRNSDGQERFYRLQPVTRQRSYDRLSLDRLSI
ncbi:hypothetical protein BDZ91DRAFT_772414 [Kalaharituber pfeilii]|nr:hypothetical protein BDZ91DRAFT_772414 [Kalaharituber pfeilii]